MRVGSDQNRSQYELSIPVTDCMCTDRNYNLYISFLNNTSHKPRLSLFRGDGGKRPWFKDGTKLFICMHPYRNIFISTCLLLTRSRTAVLNSCLLAVPPMARASSYSKKIQYSSRSQDLELAPSEFKISFSNLPNFSIRPRGKF